MLVEEKDFRGTVQGSVAGVHMGLCSALKGSVGLCGTPWLGIAFEEPVRKSEHPDLTTICGQVKFTDCKGRKGNRGTPVIDVRGIVEIVLLLPGRMAARVRRQAADILVRYLGPSLTHADRIVSNSSSPLRSRRLSRSLKEPPNMHESSLGASRGRPKNS